MWDDRGPSTYRPVIRLNVAAIPFKHASAANRIHCTHPKRSQGGGQPRPTNRRCEILREMFMKWRGLMSRCGFGFDESHVIYSG
jgi:hypothetical protein